MGRIPPETAMLIEQYLESFDVRDYHQLRVAALADTVYAVLRSMDPTRSWIVQALFALHSLPGRLRRFPCLSLPAGTFPAQALAVGWVVHEEARGASWWPAR
jgi:hypothetical protein